VHGYGEMSLEIWKTLLPPRSQNWVLVNVKLKYYLALPPAYFHPYNMSTSFEQSSRERMSKNIGKKKFTTNIRNYSVMQKHSHKDIQEVTKVKGIKNNELWQVRFKYCSPFLVLAFTLI